MESHRRSAKYQRGSFHETKSSQTFLKHAIQILQINYFLFHFNKTNRSLCFLCIWICFVFRILTGNAEKC